MDMEQSLLEGTFNNDDGSELSSLTNDPDFPGASSSGNKGDDIKHASPPTPELSSSNPLSEITLARDDAVST